jgi:hypothetical protein
MRQVPTACRAKRLEKRVNLPVSPANKTRLLRKMTRAKPKRDGGIFLRIFSATVETSDTLATLADE